VCTMTEVPVTELAEALVRKAQDAAAKEA
jgi:hypothetical protein